MEHCLYGGLPEKRLISIVITVISWFQEVVGTGVARSLSGRDRAAGKQAAREQANRQVERILDRYGNNILRLAYSYVHNMSDAEDILQDTLLRFLKHMPKFENNAHEKAWLLRVAANLSKNKIEYNRVRDTDELSETLAAQEQEDLSFVWEAVKELPEAYREIIHLYYYEGYSTAQVADILGKKETTVRSGLRRGRDQLKGILKEVYDFEDAV